MHEPNGTDVTVALAQINRIPAIICTRTAGVGKRKNFTQRWVKRFQVPSR